MAKLILNNEESTYPQILERLRELAYEGQATENPPELHRLCRDEFLSITTYLHKEKVLGPLSVDPEKLPSVLEGFLDLFRLVSDAGPEYVQISQSLPSHIWENDDADWGSSDQADYLMEDLLELLNMEAPPFYYFGSNKDDEQWGYFYAEESDPNGFLKRE